MSLYLGNQKVGVSYATGEQLDEGDEILTAADKSALISGVKWRTGIDTGTISQMINALTEEYFQTRKYAIMSDFYEDSWTRPAAWPDLDSLNLQMSGDDFIYMTYDNTRGRAAVAWHIEKVTNGTDITVEIGHIANGVFTAYDTITGSSNNYVRWLDNSIDGDYPIVKITGDIARCYSYNVTSNGATQQYRKQPVVERIAWVPHLTAFCTAYSSNAWGTFTLQREKVGNGTGTALTSLYYAWAYCRDLADLDISLLLTPNVTNMNATFIQCFKIRNLDLRHWSVSKVTNLTSFVSTCRNLKTINLDGWTTATLTTMNDMFNTCLSLEEIVGLENFITNKVTSFSTVFANCRTIKTLKITSWNTEKVTSLSNTFLNCQNLLYLDLSDWNVEKVTNFTSCFSGCYCLKYINFDNWQSSSGITTVSAMFANCWNLQDLDVSWLQITSACTNICYMFQYCYSLKELNLPVWDVSGISSSNNCGHDVFGACWSLEKITGITNWNFQFANSLTAMFSNCYSLREVDVSGWTVSNTTNLSSLFNNCYCLTEVDLSDWDPANCTSFASMFSGCYSLISIGDISGWTTSKCTTMATMFRYCYSLPAIPDMSTWDFSEVTTLDSMFSECYSLEEVDWSNVSLPKCTIIHALFRYDYNLKSANFSNWSIPAVTNNTTYYQILGDCYNLRDVGDIIIPSTYTHLGFTNDENLSHESLLNILNQLPTTTSGHTLHLTTMNINTLTADEKLIATNKNWTLAN